MFGALPVLPGNVQFADLTLRADRQCSRSVTFGNNLTGLAQV